MKFFITLITIGACIDYNGFKRVEIPKSEKFKISNFESVKIWSENDQYFTLAISAEEYLRLVQEVSGTRVMIENIQE